MPTETLATALAQLFDRDLTRLSQEIAAFPDDATLWRTAGGITNPAGNLVLHLEGNLRDYIGRVLGGIPYTRVREQEFSRKGLSKAELLTIIDELRALAPPIIEKLTDDEFANSYSMEVFGRPLTTRQFIIHLTGHLMWHMGQIDYLRRVLTGDKAVKLAGF